MTNTSYFQKGNVPWNKGKKGLQASWNKGTKGIAKANKTSFATGSIPWNRGKKHCIEGYWKGKQLTEEAKKKISEAHKGKPAPWNSYKHSIEQTINLMRKTLGKNGKSKLETIFDEIIQRNNLPYKFVGDGQFFIESKNPDFININGEKKAVEVFNKKHKSVTRGNYEQWKKERQELFNKYGWEILFFDETQLNDEYVLSVLKGGITH